MFLGIILMVTLFIILTYVLSWIRYFNSLDPRLGQSTWRWSYDYPVIGVRDFSDLDDREFVKLRRKRNRIVTIMYFIVVLAFIFSNNLIASLLIKIFS